MSPNASNFFAAYAAGQLLMLPVAIYYLKLDYRKIPVELLRKIRQSVVLFSILLPLVIWSTAYFPGPKPSDPILSQSRPIRFLTAPSISDGDHFETINTQVTKSRPARGLGDTIFSALFHHLFYLEELFFMGCLCGFSAFLFGIVRQFRRIYRLHLLCHQKRSMKKVTLCIGDAVNTPFSMGIGRGWIFLPPGLSDGASDIIISHEMSHLRHRHTAWAILESFLAHLFWFNPLAHLIKKQGDLYRELESDAETAKRKGAYEYSRFLIQFSQKNEMVVSPCPFAQAWGNRQHLKKRILYLLNTPKRPLGSISRWVYRGVWGVCLALAIFIGISAVGDPEAVMLEKMTAAYDKRTGEGQIAYLENFPGYVTASFLLREDARFYDHSGVDYRALARALFHNLTGGDLQGASTITQQLAKTLIMADESRNIWRKIKQFRAAGALEKNYSKEQILAFYLNSIYFGEGQYGIKAAANHYFDHCPALLTPAEAAMLAIMVSKPRGNTFKKHPQRARLLQEKLLDKLVQHGHLTPKEGQHSLAQFWRKETRVVN